MTKHKESYLIIATDYFTKWIEAKPLKNVTHKDVKKFIVENIIHRFGIPEAITTDQGLNFSG